MLDLKIIFVGNTKEIRFDVLLNEFIKSLELVLQRKIEIGISYSCYV